MVRLTRALLLAIVMLGSAVSQAELLAHRSWQFQDADWTYLESAIPRAASAGMNRIQLSHHIVMDAEELWTGRDSEKRLELVRKCVALAHQHGLAVDMWTHELSGVPAEFRDRRRVRLSPQLWRWLDAKYERLFSLVPALDGLVLTFAETDHRIYLDSDVVSDATPVARFVTMIDILSAVCARHHKQLIVRDFIYEPHETQWIGEALSAVARQLKGRDNIAVMTKCVPHDWHPFFPYNPLLGRVGGLPQMVEIDLGQEFTGKSQILHCEVDYVERALAHARACGVVGAVARVERYQFHALDTPNDVNVYAFNRLLVDASAIPDDLWREWATARYGGKAAPHVIAALRRSCDITNYTLYVLGQWATNHSQISSWDYALGHLETRTTALWTNSPKDELIHRELLHPTWDTLEKVGAEKDLARRLLDRSRRDLASARPLLAATDYAELARYFDVAEDNIEVYRHHQLALLATLACQQGGGEEKAAYARFALAEARALEDWADRLQQRYGTRPQPADPARVREFAGEIRRRVKESP